MKSILINLPVINNSTAELFKQLKFEELKNEEEYALFTDGIVLFRLDKIARYEKGLLLSSPSKTGTKSIDAANVAVNWVEEAFFDVEADGNLRSPCGRFYEISIGLENDKFKSTISFWANEGFEIVENDPEVHSYVTLQWQSLKLSVYKKVQCPHIFNSPALTYFEQDMAKRIEQLKNLGIVFKQELKNKEGLVDSAIIETVEGYHLFLFAY